VLTGNLLAFRIPPFSAHAPAQTGLRIDLRT